MPLLSNAKKLFVGGTSINKVFSNGFVVWPKSCNAMDGRPNPLPPPNDGDRYPEAFYWLDVGTIRCDFRRILDIPGLYDRYQIDAFDTEICDWRTYGIKYVGTVNSPGISRHYFDKALLNDFQSYDVRVIPMFTATGLPDESVVLYAKQTPATVPSRAPSAPLSVQCSTRTPGSIYMNWQECIPPLTYNIHGYRIERKIHSADTWELLRETNNVAVYANFTEADGLVLGTKYVFRVAGITEICLSQSGFTESDPFIFT